MPTPHAPAAVEDAFRTVRFVMGQEGRETAVLLTIDGWQALLDWLEDLEDRALFVLLASKLPSWKTALLIVQPDTLLRWHRDLFRRVWRRKSKRKGETGRPPLLQSRQTAPGHPSAHPVPSRTVGGASNQRRDHLSTRPRWSASRLSAANSR